MSTARDGACGMCPGRLVEDTLGLLATTVSDLVPPEAQVHLWNAQRELLLAMAATIEHHSRARQRAAGGQARQRPSRVEID